jgi:hypothetical protein
VILSTNKGVMFNHGIDLRKTMERNCNSISADMTEDIPLKITFSFLPFGFLLFKLILN